MGMKRTLVCWSLISCLCVSALSFRFSTRRMKISTPKGPEWFQINSLGYNKCLTARFVRSYGFYTRVNLHLSDCTFLSNEQGWRWISGGGLQSALNNRCLAVTTVYRTYRPSTHAVSLQPCDSLSSDKKWVCKDGFLKLRNKQLYLTPYLYGGPRWQGYGYVKITSTATNSYKWVRHGSSNSLCTNAPEPQTTVQPATQVTTTIPQNPWFQIENKAYNKCLALRDTSKLNQRLQQPAPSLTLEICDKNSARQSWQWTSSKQLKLSHNGQCLTYNQGIRLQPCRSFQFRQQWSCYRNTLRPTWYSAYSLVSFMYSGLPFGYGVFASSYCQGSSCSWSRYDTGTSVCDDGKATTTKTPVTTKIPSAVPVKTTQPPVPSTDKSTPPIPTTVSLKTPPAPPRTPPIPSGTPPVPPKTPPIPPFPENTPPVVATTKPPPPPGNKNIRCGTKGRTGGIVNGTRAAVGSWPWQVGIRKCANCNITCGGTLINDEWVVTAAHCVSGWLANELFIVIGEVDQSKISGHEQNFRCTKIIVHEDYAFDAPYDKDIALLRLNKFAVYDDHVRPLCVPGISTVLTKKDLCTVTGFGRVSQLGAKSATLLQANVEIVSLETCTKSYASLSTPRKVTSNMLCAGYKKGGTDACQGDSGGPLTCFDRKNLRFILGGVVSWGVGCAKPDLYGVYTNTAVFSPWIQKKLSAYGY